MNKAMLCLYRHGMENVGRAYQYGGVLEDSKASYDSLRWEDAALKPSWADIMAWWPEVEAEQERAEAARQLAETDTDMLRIVEDLIEAGGDVAKLPQEALAKIAERKVLRAKLAEE